MTTEDGALAYDEAPYADLTHELTSPDRLAAAAVVLGLEPAAPERCRVLEFGCGAGQNLLALAEAFPEAELVGVDYSSAQIAEGAARAKRHGLGNVRLAVRDIRDVAEAGLGSFDFVIAHGVYSWVPPEVREALLHACKALLKPEGLVYISYNAYPGWYQMQGLREAMLYRIRGVAAPLERAELAEKFAEMLKAAEPDDVEFGQVLDAFASHSEGRRQIGGARAASLLLHDELAEVNQPVYFHEFAAHARRHGLRHLADADFPTNFAARLPRPVQEQLRKMSGDAVEFQQYLDFFTNRAFRQSILCHAEATEAADLAANPERMTLLRVGCPAQPLGESQGRYGFAGHDGTMLAVDNAVAAASLATLSAEFPRRRPFGEALTRGAAAIGTTAMPEDERAFASALLQGFCYSAKLVDLGLAADRFVSAVSARPQTTALARERAAAGEIAVTNLRHERVQLEDVEARVLALLDGSHSRADVARDAGVSGEEAAEALTFFSASALLVG